VYSHLQADAGSIFLRFKLVSWTDAIQLHIIQLHQAASKSLCGPTCHPHALASLCSLTMRLCPIHLESQHCGCLWVNLHLSDRWHPASSSIVKFLNSYLHTLEPNAWRNNFLFLLLLYVYIGRYIYEQLTFETIISSLQTPSFIFNCPLTF